MNQRMNLKVEHSGFKSSGLVGRKILFRIFLGLIGINALVVIVANLFNSLGH